MSDSFIVVKSEKALIKIYIADILYCKAEQSYSMIVLTDRNILICKILKTLSQDLSKYNFYRVNRSYLINLDSCIEIKKKKKTGITFFNKKTIELSIRSIKILEKKFCLNLKTNAFY